MTDEQPKSKQSLSKLKSTSIVKSSKSLGGLHNQTSFSRLKLRRQSYGFGSVPSIRPVERTSQLGIEFRRPPLLYLNTYQLNPTYPFHIPTVQKQIDELLDENFETHKYNAQASPALAIRLANELMHKIKGVGFNRYRIITVVTIGQRIAQCYNNAIAFQWDHQRDSYVNAQRDVYSAFIQVTVFAIYLD